MIPGKLLNNLLPRVILGTHCSVNRLAYRALRQMAPQWSLPRLHTINHFEGLQGVDGLWLHNRSLPSRSTYNPVTKAGNGLKELQYQFEALRHAIGLRRRRRIARRMAFLAHIVTDLCTPPHQHGRLVALRHKRWYLFWKIHDDWYERHVERYIVNHHLMFECHALFAPYRQTRLPVVIQSDWETVSPNQLTDAVLRYMDQSINTIRSLNLYHEYIQLGWTPAIQQQFSQQVFTQMTNAVATLWYWAFVSVRGRS